MSEAAGAFPVFWSNMQLQETGVLSCVWEKGMAILAESAGRKEVYFLEEVRKTAGEVSSARTKDSPQCVMFAG